MTFYPSTNETRDFSKSVLILPMVSTGNVAQLAVDLLISTFGMRRIGIFDSEQLIPFVAPREDGEDGVITPLELFGREGTNAYAIQQRSPVMKAYKTDFVELLLSFIKEMRFSSVLILTGVDLSNRPDSHMASPTFHWLPNSSTSPSSLSPPLTALANQTPAFFESISPSDTPNLPGAGLTRRLVSSLPVGFPPVGLVLEYVLEGNNRADAKLLANTLLDCLHQELGPSVSASLLKEPPSWSLGLFGAAHEQTLFG